MSTPKPKPKPKPKEKPNRPEPSGAETDGKKEKNRSSNEVVAFVIILVFWLFAMAIPLMLPLPRVSLTYSEFLERARAGAVTNLKVTAHRIEGDITGGKDKGRTFETVRVDPQIADELAKLPIKFEGREEHDWLSMIFSTALPLLILFALLSAGTSAARGGPGGVLSSMERSGARVFKEERIEITFADVAGVDEAKDELQEIVQFLKKPDRYSKLGGCLPKGILLGPARHGQNFAR